MWGSWLLACTHPVFILNEPCNLCQWENCSVQVGAGGESHGGACKHQWAAALQPLPLHCSSSFARKKQGKGRPWGPLTSWRSSWPVWCKRSNSQLYLASTSSASHTAKIILSAALKPRKYLSSNGTALTYMSSKRTARSFLLTLPAAQTLHERNLLWKHISLRLQLNLKQMLLPSNGNGLSNSQLCQVGLAAGWWCSQRECCTQIRTMPGRWASFNWNVTKTAKKK